MFRVHIRGAGMIKTFLRDNRYRDERALLTFFGFYLLAWTLCAALLPASMDLDSTEQVIWSRTWQWGYYKHPPMPSLLMYVLNHLFGQPSIGLTVFAAQASNVIGLLYMWLLAKRMLPRQLAITAVLITSLLAYHNFRAYALNHNTVSLPFTAASIYYFYGALRQPERLKLWLYLGIAAGFAMLTKYSALLVLASFIIYLIDQQAWKNPAIVRGLLFSILVFALLFSPHIVWLVQHDWLPFTYLDQELASSGGRVFLLSDFLLNVLMRWWYTLLVLFLLWKITPKVASVTRLDGEFDHRRFLLFIQFAPLALAMLPLLINGSALNSNWVSAFFLPSGTLFVLYYFQAFDTAQLLKNTQRVVWAVQALIILIFFGAAVIYPVEVGRSARTNYPSEELAETVVKIWQNYQAQPLSIVIADNWLGGNVLLHAHPEPVLLIDNEPIISPWLTREDVASCGALVLTTSADRLLATYADLFKQASQTGRFSLTWGHLPQGKVEHYAWAILAPQTNTAPCRFNHAD